MKTKSPSYRRLMKPPDLAVYRVLLGESDLWVASVGDRSKLAQKYLRDCRRQLAGYIRRQPEFKTFFSPIRILSGAPLIARRMAQAARSAKVGPMAAVAGAVAQYVGERLARISPEVIVENGGDIYFRSRKQRRILVHAGISPLSKKITLLVGPTDKAIGICTSSGTVGPSFSYGLADAVVIIAASSTLADAVATLAGNAVKLKSDIPEGLKLAKKVQGVTGALIIKDNQLGVWGKIKLA